MFNVGSVEQEKNSKQHYIARLIGMGLAHSVCIGLQTAEDIVVYLRSDIKQQEDRALIIHYMFRTFAAEKRHDLVDKFLLLWGST